VAARTSTCPWTFKGKLKVFQNKTLRYPGSYLQLKTMRDLGLFSEREIKVGGVKVAPRRVLQSLFRCFRAILSANKSFIPSRSQCSWKSRLGKILATLPDELENRLREHLRKQGDLSRIVTEALESYLERIEKKAKK
jgi:hypothetical protein